MLKIFTHDAYNEGHAYLLINDKNKKAVLIDTAGIGKQVIQYIIENKIILTDVVITHGHFDHIAELDNIYLATNKPKIWIGVGDEVCLTKLRYTISKTNKYGITP
jgi:glyoxylase-like metal-dependent hydrolase (beta-lactamase superfamily II)